MTRSLETNVQSGGLKNFKTTTSLHDAWQQSPKVCSRTDTCQVYNMAFESTCELPNCRQTFLLTQCRYQDRSLRAFNSVIATLSLHNSCFPAGPFFSQQMTMFLSPTRKKRAEKFIIIFLCAFSFLGNLWGRQWIYFSGTLFTLLHSPPEHNAFVIIWRNEIWMWMLDPQTCWGFCGTNLRWAGTEKPLRIGDGQLAHDYDFSSLSANPSG